MNQELMPLFGKGESRLIKRWTMKDDLVDNSTGNIPVVRLTLTMQQGVFSSDEELDPYYQQITEWFHHQGFHVRSGSHGHNEKEGSFEFLYYY